jgi:hypothetical protein
VLPRQHETLVMQPRRLNMIWILIFAVIILFLVQYFFAEEIYTLYKNDEYAYYKVYHRAWDYPNWFRIHRETEKVETYSYELKYWNNASNFYCTEIRRRYSRSRLA